MWVAFASVADSPVRARIVAAGSTGHSGNYCAGRLARTWAGNAGATAGRTQIAVFVPVARNTAGVELARACTFVGGTAGRTAAVVVVVAAPTPLAGSSVGWREVWARSRTRLFLATAALVGNLNLQIIVC